MENIITEEILCKVKEMEIETFQIESEKKKVESEMERTSVTCGATRSGLIYMQLEDQTSGKKKNSWSKDAQTLAKFGEH